MKRVFLILLLIAYMASSVSASADEKSKNAPGKAVVQDGKAVMSLPWGSGEGKVGAANEAGAVCDFMSPTSFYPAAGKIYILDAPNFRVARYDVAGKFEAYYNLEPKVSNEVMLYTDMVVLRDGSAVVSSSREKALYKYDSAGKMIKKTLPAGVKTIMKICATAGGDIVLEDPMSGCFWMTDGEGGVKGTYEIGFQPVVLPGDRIVKLEFTQEPKPPFKISAKICDMKSLKEIKSFSFELEKPILSAIAVGGADESSLLIYSAYGEGGDAPAGAFVIKAGFDGKVIERISAPVSAEFATMRYIRMESASEVLFAGGGEDGYVLTRHAFKK